MEELLTSTQDDANSRDRFESPEAQRLAASIQSAVQRETGFAIRGLTVEITREGIRLSGCCDSFYSKQLAQHAAMTMPGGQCLSNCIEVSP
jgi:osmotically-inducible protein OsmY